jgi:hypothetical protein
MQLAPLTPPVQAFAPEFSRGVTNILTALANLISRRFLRDPRFAALMIPLYNRIRRAARRVERLVALLLAGRRPLPRAPRHGGGGPHRPNPIPSGFLWLVRELGYEAAGYASQLRGLLANPAAAELLALIPAAKRALNPIGRMLGIEACKRKPSVRAPRPPRPPKPREPKWPFPPTSPHPSALWPWLDPHFKRCKKRD